MPPLFQELKAELNGEIVADIETIQKVSTDASPFIVRPQVVVYPKTVKDIGETILFAKRYQIPLTVRGGGLGGRGAVLSEGIVLDMSRHFNTLGQWRATDHTITVQTGVRYGDFISKVTSWKYWFPAVFEENEESTLGGLFGDGHRDVRMHKMGSFLDWVESLRIMLDDGKEYVVSPHIMPYGRLREIYDETLHCLKENTDIIQAAKLSVTNNAMGYDVFGTHISPKTIMAMLFGSQGTLGVITEMTLRLAHIPNYRAGFTLVFASLHEVSTLILRGTFAQASYVLLFDKKTITYHEHFVKKVFTQYRNAAYILYAVYEGEEAAVKRDIQQAMKAANARKESTNHIESTELEMYDAIYKEQAKALMEYSGKTQTAYRMLNELVLPVEHLEKAIKELIDIPEEYGLLYSLTADCVQGVVRLEILLNPVKKELGTTMLDILVKGAHIVRYYRGSLSYNEGDGLMLTPLLKYVYGEALTEVIHSIKYIWDKKDIFNTGKKTNADFSYLINHLRHD